MKIVHSRESGVESQKDETAQTREAFDRAAVSYDTDFESLPATQRLRRIVQSQLLTCFHSGESVLELNCGTGTDAVALAQHGIRIHATDISPVMVEQTKRKAASLKLENLITTDIISFTQLGNLHQRQFDGAFSDMGGLNCTENLQEIAGQLARLIRPGGYFFACIMPGFSLWESTAFLLRGNFSKAFRRMNREGCTANVQGNPVQTYYHSPSSVRAAFAGSFEHVRTIGLNVFTPPPTSTNASHAFGSSIRLLEAIDDAVAGFAPFNSIGDHYLLVLRRKAA